MAVDLIKAIPGLFFVLIAGSGLAACALLPNNDDGQPKQFLNQTYPTVDGSQLEADVYQPPGKGPFPAVVMIHGGGWVGGERADMEAVAEALSRKGLVVMNIDYRSARQHPHPAQLQDCRSAVRWLRTHAARFNIDASHIAAVGYSAGGHLAMLLGVLPATNEKVSSRVQAVVSGAGPSNLLEYPTSGLVKRLMGHKCITGRGHLWAAASPIVHVSSDDAPTMFYHGIFDLYVMPRQSRIMAQALEQASVVTETHWRPYGHALAQVFSTELVPEMAEFIHAQKRSAASD